MQGESDVRFKNARPNLTSDSRKKRAKALRAAPKKKSWMTHSDVIMANGLWNRALHKNVIMDDGLWITVFGIARAFIRTGAPRPGRFAQGSLAFIFRF